MQNNEEKTARSNFISFVLLKKPEWDKNAMLQTLREDWDIYDAQPEDDNGKDDEYTIVFEYQGAMLSIGLMPGPIPGDEAAAAAARNYMWPDGVEQVKQHAAHLLIAVIRIGGSAVSAGELLVKLTAAACKQPDVVGVYANGTAYPPDYYQHFAGMLKENLFPVFNLVWFGLYRSAKGLCAYTNGMNSFGYDEIEVLNSAADPNELHSFISDIANYVITQDVLLQDGETIGFTPEEKLPITKSGGVAVEGESLKIAFKTAGTPKSKRKL